MRLHDLNIVNESYDINSTMRNVSSEIGNIITNVYDKLEHMAINWMDGHDNMKGFGFVAGGVKARWYQERGDVLQSELFSLSKQAGISGQELAMWLRKTPDKFDLFVISLPDILIKIAREYRSEPLYRNAVSWKKQESKYRDLIRDLDKQGTPTNKTAMSHGVPTTTTINSAPDKNVAAKSRASAISSQNTQVDQLVNTVLKHLPAGVAGEIRNAISKEGNKLSALRAELARRGISI